MPRADEVRIDVAVLAVTAALAVVTGLAFGIVPAWRALSTRLHEPLKEAGRGSVGPGQHRVRNALVVAEVSMALVLLVGAGPDAAQLLPRCCTPTPASAPRAW